MNPRWIIFLVTVWMIGTGFGFILEGAYYGSSSASVVNILVNSKALTATTLWGTITGVFSDLEVFVALGRIFIWDFSFWTGSLEIVRWILFLPISAGIGFSILLAMFRGVGSS